MMSPLSPGPSPLVGDVCVVTGGGRGIGRAIAERVGSAGASLAIVDRDAESLTATVADLERSGLTARGYVADVSSESDVRTVAAAIADDVGRVSILVNNAGFTRVSPTFDLTLESWQDSIGTMATGVFLCSREFGLQMRVARGGRIVNVSSINARSHFPMRLAYDAAKAAVEAMTQSLAIEWAGYGIRVNAVAPGVTDTDMLRDAVAAGLVDADAYLQRVPQRRFGDVREIADAVFYLVSDHATFVTGHVLTVDGGWSAFGWIPWDNDPTKA
jgi:NAD(P)-dependent dehydrogenase (short-subunit alcohol dehydrogenase family)